MVRVELVACARVDRTALHGGCYGGGRAAGYAGGGGDEGGEEGEDGEEDGGGGGTHFCSEDWVGGEVRWIERVSRMVSFDERVCKGSFV